MLFLCCERRACRYRYLLDVLARGLERQLEAAGVALGKGFDILRPLTLAAGMIRRPAVVTGMGRHGCSLRLTTQSPHTMLLVSPPLAGVNAAL